MRSKLKKIIFILIILLLMFLLSFKINDIIKGNLKKENDTKINIEKENDKEEVLYPIKNSFSLVATGDALLHDAVYLSQKSNNGSYDFTSVFSHIKDYINKFDIKYVNQETVLGDPPYSSYPLFNTPTAWGDAMIDAGFNLFSLATNHSYDKFTKGALRTLEYWQSKENIGYAGMNSSEDRKYHIEEVNGITYGFLSYTEHLNGLKLPNGYEYLVDVYNYEQAKTDIEYLKENVDVVIVAMHWGIEYISEPNEAQRTIANELADLDVDLIIGSHPHWLQPIDYIDDTLVIYSLGNFISNQLSIMNNAYYTDSVAVGALVSLDINKLTYEDYDDIVIDNIVVELIYSYRGPDRKYYVIPFSKMNETYNKNYVKIYEKHKERMTMYNDKVFVNPLGQ